MGSFLLNRIEKKWTKLKILLPNFGLLVRYPKTKIISKIFDLRKYLRKLKMVNIWQPPIELSHKMSKNPLRKLIWMQNLLNFICHTMQLHNCHHNSAKWPLFTLYKGVVQEADQQTNFNVPTIYGSMNFSMKIELSLGITLPD